MALPFVLTKLLLYVKIFEINRSLFPGRDSGLQFYRIHTHITLLVDNGKRSHAPAGFNRRGFFLY
jgi:hypothetical protein